MVLTSCPASSVLSTGHSSRSSIRVHCATAKALRARLRWNLRSYGFWGHCVRWPDRFATGRGARSWGETCSAWSAPPARVSAARDHHSITVSGLLRGSIMLLARVVLWQPASKARRTKYPHMTSARLGGVLAKTSLVQAAERGVGSRLVWDPCPL